MVAVLVLYCVGIATVGMNLSTLAFLLVVLIGYAGMRIVNALIYAVVLIAGINGMFWLMRLAPPQGYLVSLDAF